MGPGGEIKAGLNFMRYLLPRKRVSETERCRNITLGKKESKENCFINLYLLLELAPNSVGRHAITVIQSEPRASCRP
jgi:hypothetical protein